MIFETKAKRGRNEIVAPAGSVVGEFFATLAGGLRLAIVASGNPKISTLSVAVVRNGEAPPKPRDGFAWQYVATARRSFLGVVTLPRVVLLQEVQLRQQPTSEKKVTLKKKKTASKKRANKGNGKRT